jgi:arylsulfatase A
MANMKITRRDFLKAMSVAMAGMSMPQIVHGCGSRVNNQKSYPNFIIIFTDDQGYGDLGVFGAVDIATPHIDRMSREGETFTNFYVGGPVCTPSRAGLLTGCYPKRVGLQEGVLFPNDKKGLHPDEVTIADILKQKGYATACMGKWHLGRPPELLPTRQGFDYYFGVPYSNDMNPRHIMSKAMGDFPDLPLMRNEEVIEAPVDQTTLTRRYTEEAISFIKKNKNNPFFIYLAHSMPHYPCHSSDSFVDSSKRGDYGDAVQEIDSGVGKIIKTLQRLGIDNNTLIIFTSDNGPWKEAGVKDFLGMGGDGTTGSALPLSGWKGHTLEGGMRVPTVMRWPGRLPANTRCDELACTLDLLPTIACLINAGPPGDRIIDGKDISGLLKDPSANSPHDYFYYYSSSSKNMNAIRDSKGFKLHMWRDPEGYGNDGPYEVKELYFLPDDIAEKNNLYEKRPDVVKRLREAAAAFDANLIKNSRPIAHVP